MNTHDPSAASPADRTRTARPAAGSTRGSPATRTPPRPPAADSSARSLRRSLLTLAALAPFAAPVPVAALEFECSLPDDTRYLRVDLPGEEHLCEVSVFGGRGGEERRVMWYADNETLFCSAKAYELRDKYVDTWSFDCSQAPDRDGIDLLSPRHRAILDTQLKSLLARAADDAPEFRVTGVRAAASSPMPESASLLALQFFLADGTDLVRVIADEGGRWRTYAEARDLAASVPAADGFRTAGVFVLGIDGGGALEVTTLLERDGAPPCEGRASLQVDADGTFAPTAPHRHACAQAPLAASDAG